MEIVKQYTGKVFPLDRSNVDTDAIIPKQYLKSVKKTGFGATLFDDWRYLDPGILGQDHTQRRLNSEFELNQARYADASVLLARDNFGCGSSREHAVWALMEFGFRAVIAPSFSDIFYNNCINNGLLPIVLSLEVVDLLFARCRDNEILQLTIDLSQQQISDGSDQWTFQIDKNHKQNLLQGLDEIDLTLKHSNEIRKYEEQRRKRCSWIFENNER